MKSEHYTGESHNKPGGANGTEPMLISCNMCDSPIDEGGHPSTLDAYCECYQNRGGAGLAKKVHCSSHCWPAALEAKSAPVYSMTTRDGLPRTTQLPNALRWVIAFHTIAVAAIVVSKPIPNKTTFLPALAENVRFRMLTAVRGRRLPRSQSHQNRAPGIPAPSLRR